MRKSQNPNKIYESISAPISGKNSFDATHVKQFTTNVGLLTPCLVKPVHPGDQIYINHRMQVRFPALVVPAEVRMDAYIHTFYVPERVLWENFDEWFEPDGEDTYSIPRFQVKTALSATQQKFMDYFGIMPIADATQKKAMMIKAAPFAAYQKIYNDYYRPRPFQDPIAIELTSGTIADSLRDRLLTKRLRCYEHDYQSSMLTEPMVAPDVTLGVGNVALKMNWNSVHGADPGFVDDNKTYPGANESTGTAPFINNDTTLVPNAHFTIQDGLGPARSGRAWDPDGSLEVEATTINALREAYARQRYLEKMGRSGGEYYEVIMALYGERIPDGRLQRAEYITGMQAPMIINPVLSTSDTTGAPIGQQAGHAIVVGNGNGKKFKVPEHGYIMSIFSCIPKPVYSQALPRHFRAFTREDYLIPDFAHIGEQPIESWEITPFEEDEGSYTTIGYLPNYTDKKQMLSSIAGEYRTSLAAYVATKIYDTGAGIPVLNKAFVEVAETACDHLFVTASGITDNLWCTVLNIIDHELPLPVYSDPI